MALAAISSALHAELGVLEGHLRDFAAAKGTIGSAPQFTLPDEALIEGLLSRVWQSWCTFCRSSFIQSCMGTVTAAGAPVAALHHAHSEHHVSDAVRLAAIVNRAAPYWVGVNHILRREPTWGDVDTLARLLQRLQPTNHPQMALAFSPAHSSAKAVQTIRNAAAHHNHQTMADVQNLQSAYVVFPITHPVHALFWTVPSSNDYLFARTLDDLKVAATAAVA